MPVIQVKFRRFTSLNTRIRLREGQILASLSALLEGAPPPPFWSLHAKLRAEYEKLRIAAQGT